MNTTAAAPAELTAADLRRTAEQRVATCDIYIGRRALVAHNTVVVSSIYNGRGVQQVAVEGNQQRMAVAMFPKGMPTCYTPADAAELAKDFNEQFEEAGVEERVRCVLARDWWQEERAAALRSIAFMDKHDVR